MSLFVPFPNHSRPYRSLPDLSFPPRLLEDNERINKLYERARDLVEKSNRRKRFAVLPLLIPSFCSYWASDITRSHLSDRNPLQRNTAEIHHRSQGLMRRYSLTMTMTSSTRPLHPQRSLLRSSFTLALTVSFLHVPELCQYFCFKSHSVLLRTMS